GRAGVLPDDRRVGRPAGRVDRHEGGSMAVDADPADLAGIEPDTLPGADGKGPDQLARREGNGPPPGLRILLGSACRGVPVGGIAGSGEPDEPTVEPDQADLHLRRAEVDREDDRLPAPHATGSASVRRRTASAVDWSVTSAVRSPPRSAPR